QLMLALYRAGRQSDALRAFQRLRRVLVDELGLEPGRAVRELEAAILAHDPALGPSDRPPARTLEPDLPTLPTGNVTFVFSEVERATTLAQLLGARYPDILEEHRRMVGAAMTAHGGSLVDATGD